MDDASGQQFNHGPRENLTALFQSRSTSGKTKIKAHEQDRTSPCSCPIVLCGHFHWKAWLVGTQLLCPYGHWLQPNHRILVSAYSHGGFHSFSWALLSYRLQRVTVNFHKEQLSDPFAIVQMKILENNMDLKYAFSFFVHHFNMKLVPALTSSVLKRTQVILTYTELFIMIDERLKNRLILHWKESLATKNLKASLKTTLRLIFSLSVCKEKSSLFLRHNYLPSAVITFNFPYQNSDFPAMVIEMSMLHLREAEKKIRQSQQM